MSFLFGEPRLEKCGQIKVLHFGFSMTLNVGAVPTNFAANPPLSPAIVGMVTANGAGILLPAVTFAGLSSTAAANTAAPVIGLEIADGMFASQADKVIGVVGTVQSSTGAANITGGSPIFSTAVYASPGVGVAFNVAFGLAPATAIANYFNSLVGANGVLNGQLMLYYYDR